MALLSRRLNVLAFILAIGCSDARKDATQSERESPASTRLGFVTDSDTTKQEGAKPLSEAAAASQESVYDETADGVQQIADALAIARENHQRVLLQYGANWCGWCCKLHTLFQTDEDIARKLTADYVVVMIDVNNGHNMVVDEKYGKPTRFGLPAIVILDVQGNQLTTKDTNELEEGDHHSPEKVMAFLQEWSPRK
jgi:thiol:disulfide interchange protein